MRGGKTTRPWIYYGWVIVGTSFTAMAFHQTARFSFSIFQVPLIQEFGWGRGALGGAYALMLGSYALVSPFTGNLFDKKGARAVMPWGSVLVGVGFTLAYFISELWHVYLVPCLFVGLGMALSGFAMHSALMPQWFQKKRGLATGLALSGSGTGILLFIPLIEWLISTKGWRLTYLIFGLAVLFIVVPITALLLRRGPEDVDQYIDGESEPPAHSATKSSEKSHSPPLFQVFRQVCKQKNFWTLLIVVFFMGLNNNSILSQLQLYLVDAEYSTALAAFFFGMLGAIRMLATFSMGWLSDFIGRKRAQGLSSFITVCGIVILLSIPHVSSKILMGWVFIFVYGMGLGGMSVCYSSMSADAFKGPSFGATIGLLEIFFGLGGFIGPPLAGYLFDYTGSYMIPFVGIAIGLVCCIFMSLFVYETPRGTS
ncbi:MAG: MFS transporter [Nitrospinae bacterium]|nr:MFS transporter [Nitrospinota bacterium]